MGINYAKGPFIMGVFTAEGVIQNGSIFKSRTHTSGHFDIGVAPRALGAVCAQSPSRGPALRYPIRSAEICLESGLCPLTVVTLLPSSH